MAHHNHARAQALLEKFHAGKCTPEELALLNSWYDDLGEQDQKHLSAEASEHYRQQFLTRFRNQLPRQKVVSLYRRHLFKWAAASLLLIAGAGYIWMQRGNPPVKQVAENKVFHITNETGQAKQVVLTDSSVVWLNSHSSVSWKGDYNGNDRRVTFTGEGYFDIRPDAGRPFIIDTRELKIRVLGTAFNVEAYPGETTSRVSLVRGSVKLNAVKDTSIQVVLQPGYAASLLEQSNALTVRETKIEDIAAWKKGGFVIKNLSIRDAIVRLCERNGHRVRWANTKDLQKTISVDFAKQSFEQSLGNLCYIIHKQYKISGTQVTIY